MKMKFIAILAGVFGLLSSCAKCPCGHQVKEIEHEIAVKDVPKNVLAAAQKSVPGFQVESAELEVKPGGKAFYELEGKGADGVRYELEICPAGRCVKKELD